MSFAPAWSPPLNRFDDAEIFATEHAFVDEREAFVPMRFARVALRHEHRVREGRAIRCARRAHEHADEIGMQHERRARKNQIARRRELARVAIRAFACLVDRAARGERANVRTRALGLDERVDEEPIDRIAMQMLDVVAVEKRIDDELPIRCDVALALAMKREMLDADRREIVSIGARCASRSNGSSAAHTRP